jgi:hypothetical protein
LFLLVLFYQKAYNGQQTLMLLDDRLPDIIALTSVERTRLAELEGVVQTRLETFLTVGRALAEIRNRRLYREQYGTWEDYCAHKWGFNYGRANDLVRSAQIADLLLAGPAGPAGDAPLPDNVSPDSLRPLGPLEPELASSCWRLASKMGKPTAHTVRKVVRTITGAIGQGTGAKPKVPPSERKVFWLSLCRLSGNPRFCAHLFVTGLDEGTAKKHLAAVQQMICRLHEIVEAIRSEYPGL